MKKLVVLILFWASSASAGFYVWYDDQGEKNVSTHPRLCIDEVNKTLKLECQLSESYAAIQGDPEVAKQTIERARWKAENPNIEMSECGYPGKVYVGDIEASGFLKKFQNSGIAGDSLIIRLGPAIVAAQTRASETCEDVRLKLKSDPRLAEKFKQDQMRRDIGDIKYKLNRY
jgi:hypothetical protein